MYWLAINREWTSITELLEDIVPRVSRLCLLEVLESLTGDRSKMRLPWIRYWRIWSLFCLKSKTLPPRLNDFCTGFKPIAVWSFWIM